MSDFSVHLSIEDLTQEALRLWPLAESASHDEKLHREQLLRGAARLVWGTPRGANGALVLETLRSPERLQLALKAFEEGAHDIVLWADRFRSSPDGRVDVTRHAQALA